jgi:hypothetical protein
MVIRTLSKNISLAQEAIKNMVAMIDETAECDCQNALQNAIITNRDHIDPAKQAQIKLLIEKYLD